MNEQEYKNRLAKAVKNPRLQCLFLEALMAPQQDRHFVEAYNGFQELKKYTQKPDPGVLEKASRLFDYVTDLDKKYIRAIAYYGKSIANGYYQSPAGFQEAYKNLRLLKNIALWNPKFENFIEDLQTEGLHLEEDLRERDSELYPIGAWWRRL